MPTSSVTRRRFLKSTAAAGAFLALPTIIPSSVLGKGGSVAPSERIVMGAIGVGGRGTHDMRWLLGQPQVQMVAMCDVQKSRREAVKQMIDSKNQNKDCVTYRDLREFLAERTDIDAVLIATGDRWHAMASILAMRAGKDVYCEKPSCLTIAQGWAVVETAERFGRVFQTGAQRLSEPHHVLAIELARNGGLGRIHTAYADCRYRGGQRHDWLPAQPQPPREELDWDLWLGGCPMRPYNSAYLGGGGKWYDHYDMATDVAMWGAHTIAQALAGLDMTDVSSIHLQYGGPDATLNGRLSNGLKLVLYRCEGSVWKPCEYWHGSCGERFDGEDGWAAAADGYAQTDVSSPALLQNQKKILNEYVARTGRSLNHVLDFLDCIRSRRLTVAHPQVMFQSMAICLAADICLELRRDVTFDLLKCEFVGDAQANRMMSRAQRDPWQL